VERGQLLAIHQSKRVTDILGAASARAPRAVV
jgi:hypothetical protein